MTFLFALVCAILQLSAEPAMQESIDVGLVLSPMNAATLPGVGTVVLTNSDDPSVVVTLDVGRSMHFRAARGSRWILRSNISGWWMPQELLVVDGAAIERKIWRATRVSGTVRVADAKTARPDALQITIEKSPVFGEAAKLPSGAMAECPVDGEGRFACDIPIGKVDLAFRAAGFIPHYRWGTTLVADVPLKVGTLDLKRGASVAAWVAQEDGRTPPKKAVARLGWAIAPGADGELAERLSRPVAVTNVLPSGFFQLTGIEPGTYELSIAQEGFADARIYPIEVQRNAETSIKRVITLTKAVDLQIRIEPPTIDGNDWRVRAYRLSDFGGGALPSSVFDGVSHDGEITIRGQGKGRFVVRVADGENNPWAAPEISHDEIETTPHIIRIDAVQVTGTVLRADRPVATTLWFGGRRGAVHVKANSAEDGTFSIALPHEGKWRVEIATNNAGVAEVETNIDADAARRATITLRMPDHRVKGIVQTRDGRPEAGANVVFSNGSTMLNARSDESGRFLFDGVPAGTARLRARGRANTQSATEVVEVGEDATVIGPVVLQMLSGKSFEGRVVSAGQPVVGAVLVFRAPGFGDSSVTTDLEGRFTANLPQAVDVATVTVFPPGHALRAFQVTIDDRPAELNVTRNGGTLRLIRKSSETRSGGAPQFFQNATPIPMTDLLRWIDSQNAWSSDPNRMDIPNLAPGNYRICIAAACQDIQLAPGAVMDVEIAP